ncbi:MAG: DUF6049 family protein [Acidimicrobiales bacterium]
MGTRLRAALALATVILVGAPMPTAAARSAAPAAPSQAGPSIELVGQTAVAEPGGTFSVRVRLEGVPGDGSLQLDLHQRVRSRSELAVTMEGTGLGNLIAPQVTPIDALAPDADGVRTLSLSLDPAAGGVTLPAQGVYPVAVRAFDAGGAEVASLVTHLIAPPLSGDESPPLAVAVVAHLGAPPARQPDGTTSMSESARRSLGELAGAFAAVPEVAATLAVTPETVDVLAGSSDEADLALLELLRSAVAGRTVLRTPYVDISADQLARAGLLGELAEQLRRGEEVLRDELGASPVAATWLADPDLGAAGLEALAASGVEHAVVAADQVAPLPSGVLSFSLAQPFALAPPDDEQLGRPDPSGITALAIDPTVVERLEGDGTPGLVVSRVLAELAMVRLERPGIARALVVPVHDDLDPAMVTALLQALGAGAPYAPLPVVEAVDATAPVRDAAGNVVERALVPTDEEPAIGSADAARLQSARDLLATFDGLLGGADPRTAQLAPHLLLSTARSLSRAERQAHVDAVVDQIDALTSAVSTPERATITLTAREGTVPLTIRNDAGTPLEVSIRASSTKLEFPDGEVQHVTLTEETTRIDIAVLARASGSFPLDVEITTPDGRRQLTSTRFTVQSTAVSGVGIVLSVGAGLFLVAWWASHWRRTRRSARLISADHPTRARHLSDG